MEQLGPLKKDGGSNSLYKGYKRCKAAPSTVLALGHAFPYDVLFTEISSPKPHYFDKKKLKNEFFFISRTFRVSNLAKRSGGLT